VLSKRVLGVKAERLKENSKCGLNTGHRELKIFGLYKYSTLNTVHLKLIGLSEKFTTVKSCKEINNPMFL